VSPRSCDVPLIADADPRFMARRSTWCAPSGIRGRGRCGRSIGGPHDFRAALRPLPTRVVDATVFAQTLFAGPRCPHDYHCRGGSGPTAGPLGLGRRHRRQPVRLRQARLTNLRRGAPAAATDLSDRPDCNAPRDQPGLLGMTPPAVSDRLEDWGCQSDAIHPSRPLARATHSPSARALCALTGAALR